MGRLFFGLTTSVIVLLIYFFFLGQSNLSEVSIYNWSNYISQDILDDFEEETGIKVTYNAFDSNEALETNLLVGGNNYDVVTPSAAYLKRQISAGVYQKLDKSHIPNLSNIWPELLTKLLAAGVNTDYSATYAWGTSGLGYNRQKIIERIPDAPLDSLELLFNVKLVSKLADCGVYVLDASDEMIPAALNYLGLDPASRDRNEILRAAKILKRIQPYIRKFHSSVYVDALANGEACLVFGWSGDILQAKAAAEAAGNGNEIIYVIPKQGSQIWFDQMAIPASAPNPKNAHVFINYILDKKISKRLLEAIYYPTAIRFSIAELPHQLQDNPNLYPSAELLKKLYIMPAYENELRKFVSQVWLEIKLGL